MKERNPDANWPQHFYVAKYTKDKAFTYMFWQEMKLLWIMSPGGLDEESWLGVRYPGSGQLIDLQNSVVSTADKVGSSSYLVTKDWAANRFFDTVIKGDLIIINESLEKNVANFTSIRKYKLGKQKPKKWIRMGDGKQVLTGT